MYDTCSTVGPRAARIIDQQPLMMVESTPLAYVVRSLAYLSTLLDSKQIHKSRANARTAVFFPSPYYEQLKTTSMLNILEVVITAWSLAALLRIKSLGSEIWNPAFIPPPTIQIQHCNDSFQRYAQLRVCFAFDTCRLSLF